MRQSASRTRWLIVLALFGVYILMFIDRVNISIAAKYIMDEFGISNIEMGLIFSTFVFGYALFQIPGGWLGDRFGPRRVLAVAIAWWSLFTALTAIAADTALRSLVGAVGALAIARFLIGVGEAAAPPNGARVITNWIPPSERGLAFGITFGGNMLGAAVAPPLIVWIMLTWGWREAFYIAGTAGIVVALFWWLISTDRPADHPWVNEAEREHIAAATAADPSGEDEGASDWREVLRSRKLWCVTAAYFTVGYILYLYFAWFYLYLVNARGLSIETAGIYTTAPFVVSALCAPLGGRLSDHLSRRYGKGVGQNGMGMAGLLVTAVCIVCGAAVTNVAAAVFLLSLGAGAIYATMATYWASSVDISRKHAGFAAGFMNMGCNIGGIISPTLTPILADRFGWNVALFVAAGVAISGALFWLGVPSIAKPLRPMPSAG